MAFRTGVSEGGGDQSANKTLAQDSSIGLTPSYSFQAPRGGGGGGGGDENLFLSSNIGATGSGRDERKQRFNIQDDKEESSSSGEDSGEDESLPDFLN